ncbi:MAG: hypothetical protein Q9227_003007 [Pyrenula ochraceoflavens]
MASSPSQHLYAATCTFRRHYTTPTRAAQKISCQKSHQWSRSIATSRAYNAVEATAPGGVEQEKPKPARIVPASPSYFTASPRFNDHFLNLEALVKKYGNLPTVPTDQAGRKAWVKLAHLKGQVGEPISSARYSKIIQMLQRLSRIHPDLMPAQVAMALRQFMRPGDPYAAKPPPMGLDEWGRARAIGRRKTSTARVWLVEGRGEVLVNGKNLIEAFPRMHDRESALWALKITQRMEKYNVWTLVSGGGVTGQAEAITLGLARALLVHEPGLKPILRKAGCVTVDARQVERKKPGRLKARKKPAWVKR